MFYVLDRGEKARKEEIIKVALLSLYRHAYGMVCVRKKKNREKGKMSEL
jgi:hypothetical protein